MNTDFLLLQVKDLDQACVERISRLKMQYWSYPLEEQKNWFYEKTNQTDFHLLGYNADGNLVGYLRITKRNLAIRGSSVVANGISSVCVDGECRGCGIGKKLMQKAEEIVKSNNKNKTVVIAGIGAKQYFAKLGYKHDGPYMSKIFA